MQEQLISYETAKIAKEKGFDEKCSFSYKEVVPVELYQHEVKKYNNSWKQEWGYTTRKNSDMINAKVNRYSATTQSLLQSWLREVHKIHISLTPIPFNQEDFKWIFKIGLMEISSIPNVARKNSYSILAKENEVYYNSHEDALEAGLQEALKLI